MYTLEIVNQYDDLGYYISYANTYIVLFLDGRIIDSFFTLRFFNDPKRLLRFFDFLSGKHVKIDKQTVKYFVKYFKNFMVHCTKLLPNLKNSQSTLYKHYYNNIKNKMFLKKRDSQCIYLYDKMEEFVENLGIQIYFDDHLYVLKNFNNNLPNNEIKYLVGPNYFSEFCINNGMENEKNIAIFGEKHFILKDFEFKYIVPNLDRKKLFYQFLKDIVTENPDKEFDIYLEIPYTKEFRKDSFRYFKLDAFSIQTIEMEFASCFDLIKRCKFSNTRGHYIDYRFLPEFAAKEKKLKDLIKTKKLDDREEFEYICQKLISFTKKLSKNKKFSKNPYLQEYIHKTYLTELKPRLDFSNDFYKNHLNLTLFMIQIGVLFVDYYVLSRIIKKESNYQKNIIIYTGSNHSKHYTDFFQNLVGSKLQNIYDATKNQKLFCKKENDSVNDNEILLTSKSVELPFIDIMKLDTENSFLFNKNKIL